MLIGFVKGAPALLVKKEKVLVVGDLHVGLDLKYKEQGMIFPNATAKMAAELRRLYDETGASSLVLLGDVKESITYPRFSEFLELKKFFGSMEGIDIRIVRGNHDGDLVKVLKSLELDIPIEKEILLDNVALVHGNAWPSEDAMVMRYVVSAHGHFAIDLNGRNEKAWLVAKAGRRIGERYSRFNRNVRLVMMPPFNDLITGARIGEATGLRMTFFKQGVFDWRSSKVYDLEKRPYEQIGMPRA